MLRCYNRGCGQEYEPQNNNDDSCLYHPGEPYFHDVYKGWSCCKKKSVDFTEFLSIKGCTSSQHSNVKPPEPVKQPKVNSNDEVMHVTAPNPQSMQRPPVDSPLLEIKATVAVELRELIDNISKSFTKDNSSHSNEIAVGTLCKNSGCTYSYTGTDSDKDKCQYHSGVPNFHDGLKCWSCCERKTSDFAAFMSQRGCVYGEHKYFKEIDDKKVVKCRYAWHQTAKDIVVSIYAKKYHYALSVVEVNPVRLHCILVFPDQENAKFEIDLELRGVISVENTRVHMYGTKVEITMPKAEPGSWTKLDFPREKLPPPIKEQVSGRTKSESANTAEDDDFNLDDIEIINKSTHLSELAASKSDSG